jgi:hypothetical protein
MLVLTLLSVLLLSCGSGASEKGAITKTSGSLTVQLLEPQDETTVRTSVISVRGQAPADTVVTVNDDILVVGSDAKFETQVTLDEGPNVVEIVASDTNGDEVSFNVTVTYQP